MLLLFIFQRIIEYLKIDIEYSEWDSLATALNENILHRVKHFGIETHIKDKIFKNQTTHTKDFAYFLNILKGMENLGFRKFSTHYNAHGVYASPRTGLRQTCCMELVYLNINFLKPDYESTLV